jgi:hypothetical protein
MNSTFSSVFITSEDQPAAQADLGEGYFTAPLSADGTAPATHYWSTGYWYDEQLDFICNEATWPKTVKFGDAQAALASMSLQQVLNSSETTDE